MYRRLLSALTLVSLLLAAGCLTATIAPEGVPEPDTTNTDVATQVPQPNEHNPVPRDLPAAPDTITAETVATFVATYEEVRMHNELVGTHSNLVSIGTSCTADSVEPADGAYTVTVECGHWYEFADGDNRGIADGAPYAVIYSVSDDGHLSPGEREPIF